MGDSNGDEDGGGVNGDGSGGNSPSRRRAGTETSVPRNGVSRWRRRPWSLSGVSSIVVGFSVAREYIGERAESGEQGGSLPTSGRGQGATRAALWCGGPGPPLRLPFGVLVR